jgi:7,8-dihydroneopterin aldolase/epimerase/oxygenase
MTDRIVLANMRFEGHHGVSDAEQANPQPIEVDVELALDLRPAGVSDDLTRTIDYSAVYRRCRAIVEERRFRLLEAIAETIATELLASVPAEEVTIRVRKPTVGRRLGGAIDSSGVEIRRRPAGD